MVTAKKESYGKYKEKESKTATENQLVNENWLIITI